MKGRHILAGLLVGASMAQLASAQSTDGFHGIQIFPVVVDSSSFAQRFFFVNTNEADVIVQPIFYPGDGTPQALLGPVICPTVLVPALGTKAVTSLRTMCPTLVAGNAFGFLYTRETNPQTMPYAGYSRVSNPSGIGFSVEAFPAHTFTSADSVVPGIRRLAATNFSPAFQTNCFMANLNQLNPGGPTATIQYDLFQSDQGSSFAGGQVVLPPGRLVRLLDVFAAAGAPAGDYNDADIRFSEVGDDDPGIMAFCTVQDNTSFGADFRIAKQEFGNWGVGSQDGHVVRTEARETADEFGHVFQINSGNNANTHVTFFRHPDYVQCAILDANTFNPLPVSYGLEMRLLDRDGNVVAGGNNITQFGEVYLGDKNQRDFGANTMYSIEVESAVISGSVRPYALYCQSDSGHPAWYNIVKYEEPVDRF